MPATPRKFNITAEEIERIKAWAATEQPPWEMPIRFGELMPDVYTIEQLKYRPPARWLIRHVVEEQGLTVFFGPDKTGKTAVLSSLLWAWCDGQDMAFDEESLAMSDPRPEDGVEQDRKVLYVLLEGQASYYNRFLAWKDKYGESGHMDNFYVIDEGLSLFDQKMKWEDPTTWTTSAVKLWNAVEDLRPQILAIDTLSRATAGMDENSPQMAQVVGWLDHLRDTFGTATILVHHVALDAGDRPRGHSSLKGAASSYVRIKGKPDDYIQWLITGPHRNAASYNPQHANKQYGWPTRRTDYMDAFVVEIGMGDAERMKLPKTQRDVDDTVKENPGITVKALAKLVFGDPDQKAIYKYIRESDVIEKEGNRLYPVEEKEVEDL